MYCAHHQTQRNQLYIIFLRFASIISTIFSCLLTMGHPVGIEPTYRDFSQRIRSPVPDPVGYGCSFKDGRDCESPTSPAEQLPTALASQPPWAASFSTVRLHRWEHWLRAFRRSLDMVRVVRFERTIFCSQGRRVSRLRYTRVNLWCLHPVTIRLLPGFNGTL
jgi:hypothetical protein